MARMPALYAGQIADENAQRFAKSVREYLRALERRVRDAEARTTLPRTAEIALSANQGSISAGVDVAFDLAEGPLVDAGIVKLASSTITLRKGIRYRIEASMETTLTSASGSIVYQWRVGGATFNTDAGTAPRRMVALGNTNSTTASSCPSSTFVYTPVSDVALTLEVTSAANVTRVDDLSRVVITEVAS